VAERYAEVNRLFGDIVKVTPTSKVVGDMALFMAVNDLTVADVLDPEREIAFPESVVSLFRGELGFPPDGFPREISRKVLKCDTATPIVGERIAPVDLDAAREQVHKIAGHAISEFELSSWLMYPKVFADFAAHRKRYGDLSALPSPTYFYGMAELEEINIDLDPGKSLIVRLLGTAPAEEEGVVKVFFELNGQPRTLRVERSGARRVQARPQADAANPTQVAAPMPGMIVTVAARAGQAVKQGDPLVSIEAMKMETQIRAERDGLVKAVHVRPGDTVAARDLLVEMRA
jgi:pyruvate carboxylase